MLWNREWSRTTFRFPLPELVRVVTETEAGAVVIPVLHVTLVEVPPNNIPSGPRGSEIATIYESLLDWVSQEALAGDRDAAELIVLCSLARV